MNAPGTFAATAQGETHAHLTFAKASGGRSYLVRQYLPYPFHITRPFYLDREPADLATVYLQSAAGGAYRGDRLALSVAVGPGAKAHVTTQASTLVHAGRGGLTALRQDLSLAESTFLEFLPDPLILMAEADCESRTKIRLEGSATLLFSEAFLTHDPEGRGRPPKRFLSEVIVEDTAGRRLLIDRFVLGAEGRAFGGQDWMPCQASFIALPKAPFGRLLERLRAQQDETGALYLGCSSFAGERGLFVRLLAENGATLTRALAMLWQSVREELFEIPPVPRRK